MRMGRWWLSSVALVLFAVRLAHAQDPRPTPTVAKAVSFTAALDKDFPFDLNDKRPPHPEADGPYAQPVRRRPGLVISPLAPDAG